MDIVGVMMLEAFRWDDRLYKESFRLSEFWDRTHQGTSGGQEKISWSDECVKIISVKAKFTPVIN
jgi:hypothetical protein